MLSGALNALQELRTGDSLRRSAGVIGRADITIREVCTAEFLVNLALVVDGLMIMSRNFDSDPSPEDQMQKLKSDLESKSCDRREAVIAARLAAIVDGVQNNLNSRKFMFIPEDQAKYYDNPDLMAGVLRFGEAAILEMREAGNCFALSRGTACVFHCMRVAEYGLRHLARRVGAKISSRGKRCPIEFGDWGTVITAINNKISKARQRPAGPRRDELLRFYSDAADHCSYMKDIWRNDISHAQRRYNKPETLGVLNRVQEFMKLLATEPQKRKA